MRRSILWVSAFAVAFALALFFWKFKSPKPVDSSRTVQTKPNILLITIDTLRPDHLGAYGYQNIRTPVFDGLARKGVLFQNAVCQTPLTLVSHASLFTGLNPNVHGVRDNAYFNLDPAHKTMAEYLKEQGYKTAAFIGSAILDRRHGLAQGFDWYSRYQPTIVMGMESQRRAEEVVSDAIHWLQKSIHESEPFHVWIHLYDPHTPYDPPEPFRSSYPGAPYDGEIAYTDHVLGVLFTQLEQLGFMSNSLTILMSDHGESLGEHRENDHGYYIYDATMKVPLVISWPGRFTPGTVADQVQTIDVLPTLADLLNFSTEGTVQGKSMKHLLQGRSAGREAAYGESLTPKLYYGWSELTSLRTNEWKYIHAPEPELYNLKEDPSEVRNLIQEKPEQARRMRDQLLKMTAATNKSRESATLDAERLEQLAALGYIGAANPAVMLGTTSTIDPKTKIDDYLLHHQLVPQAVAFIDQGKYDAALRLLNQVESRFTNSFVVYWYKGLATAKLNQLEPARKAYSRAIELNPYFGRAYTDLALTLQLLGQNEEALKLLDNVPANALSSTERDYTRGEIHMNQGNLPAAEQAYKASLQSDPQNTETQYALARLYLAMGRIEEAVENMRRLSEIRYPSEDVYYSLSAVYQKQGKTAEAESILKQWIEIFPRSAAPYYRYGTLLAMKGDRQQAITYLRMALEIDPSFKEAAQALNQLQS